ncbi:uncharacterized protein E0L32_011540 [Thyridium curvatum]|uniref:Uncharacterized protein n=1 Tax=Thyridium curvatum TaxID=1093900 RepID=A0A507BNG1_9PEZI|nr:uncharacterized protein E0L32_011540 [Thyridium curvatum]TPX18791.1 hypothetical protein E0L32_011540 [Thyridium curvatum]
MSSLPSGQKRPASEERDPSISPPPLKRKLQSTISSQYTILLLCLLGCSYTLFFTNTDLKTEDAVASFFTPASQKPKDRTNWTERAPDTDTAATLLVAKYEPADIEQKPELPSSRSKIAAFDLDSTLITSASGKKHAEDPGDWKWWDNSVPEKLRKLYYEEGYRIIIFTNQGGLTLHADPKAKGPKNAHMNRVGNFKQKCNAVLSRLDLPVTLYAATAKDIFRKPRIGMWREMQDDLSAGDIDLEHSIFVGDAGGRTALLKGGAVVPKDFSCSDRNFAHNVGIRYQTPEEYFLGEHPRDFVREFDLVHHPFAEHESEPGRSGSMIFEKVNKKDIVLFCGPPGAGKSTFFWKHLKPLGYERVNQDTLKSKEKCFKTANEYLRAGKSVAIDNTNADAAIRSQWIDLAKRNCVPIRCVWFKTPLALCEHNDTVRALNSSMNPETRTSLPQIAFRGFSSRFKEPKEKEGFQDIVELEFKFRGTKEEHDIWARYWL